VFWADKQNFERSKIELCVFAEADYFSEICVNKNANIIAILKQTKLLILKTNYYEKFENLFDGSHYAVDPQC